MEAVFTDVRKLVKLRKNGGGQCNQCSNLRSSCREASLLNLSHNSIYDWQSPHFVSILFLVRGLLLLLWLELVTSRYEKAVHLSWFDFLYPFMLDTPALEQSKWWLQGGSATLWKSVIISILWNFDVFLDTIIKYQIIENKCEKDLKNSEFFIFFALKSWNNFQD